MGLSAIQSINGSITAELPVVTPTSVSDSQAFAVLCINTRNSGLTTFEGFPFNSFCKYNGAYLGCARDGIYEISKDYDSDDGDDINWQLRTGYVDLESDEAQKQIRHAWLGYKSDGDLVLTVVAADGNEYPYEISGASEDEGGIRVKFGKGMKQRYVAFDLKNMSGATMRLDKLKIFAEAVGHKKR